MPYKLRWEGHGVYRRFFDVVSSAEFREADIVHATVAKRTEMLAHVLQFESLPLAPYPEATFATVSEARRWIASNPRPAWRGASPPATK